MGMILEIKKNNNCEFELLNQLSNDVVILTESEIHKLKMCKTIGDLNTMFSSDIYRCCDIKSQNKYKMFGYNPVSITRSENFFKDIREAIQIAMFKGII
jgi:hypothetical protein